MTGTRFKSRWKILAPVDLHANDSSDQVEDALGIAGGLHAEICLLSVVSRRRFESGPLPSWPPNAFGSARPELDIHRVVLPAPAPEAISSYADRVSADVVVVRSGYRVRNGLWKRPVAASLAALTTRPIWVMPPDAGAWISADSVRIACIIRLNEEDDRILKMGQAVVQRCGGELVVLHFSRTRSGMLSRPQVSPAMGSTTEQIRRATSSLCVPVTPLVIDASAEDAIVDVADEHHFGLIVAARPMFVEPSARSGDLVSLAGRLPCPLLSVPFLSACSAATVPAHCTARA